jgi:hypothetical protein
MRAMGCNLLVQLLLGLARAVALRSKYRITHDHILLSHMRLLQLEGQGPSIYIPLEQGVPVIPPGTGFPFCRLLRLTGLQWSYSNPLPHRGHVSKAESKVMLWLTVSQSTCLGSEPTLGLWPDIISHLKVYVAKFLSCLCGALSLTRGRVCHLSVCMNIKYVHFTCLHS